jgi:hypothetical protein
VETISIWGKLFVSTYGKLLLAREYAGKLARGDRTPLDRAGQASMISYENDADKSDVESYKYPTIAIRGCRTDE